MSETRGKNPKDFFSEQESQRIVDAIGRAERATSGEIRLHLERKCSGGDPYFRGKEVFEKLGMTATVERNGVLIYMSVADHRFAVLGDQGIDTRVPPGFWDDLVAGMESCFRAGEFVEGLEKGIAGIGLRLAEFFPYAGDGVDLNELPDDISLED